MICLVGTRVDFAIGKAVEDKTVSWGEGGDEQKYAQIFLLTQISRISKCGAHGTFQISRETLLKFGHFVLILAKFKFFFSG